MDLVKKLREELNMPTAILLDTKGPEIRTGKLVENPVTLKAEETFTLVNDDIIGDNTKTSITYKDLYKDVEPGTTILIDDGKIELEVEKIEGKDIVCKVMNGGDLGNRKSINVPGRHINLPALKEINDYFLAYNSKVILNMPNLRIISDKQSSHIKFMIYCNKMCNYARKTSKIRKLVKK